MTPFVGEGKSVRIVPVWLKTVTVSMILSVKEVKSAKIAPV